MVDEVRSCGCRYEPETSKCLYLCQKHKDETILALHNGFRNIEYVKKTRSTIVND